MSFTRLTVCLFALLVTFTLAGGYYPQNSIQDDEQNAYHKNQGGNAHSNAFNKQNKFALNKNANQDYASYNRANNQGKNASQRSKNNSKFIDQQSKKKNIHSRARNDIDAKHNQLQFGQQHLIKSGKNSGTHMKNMVDNTNSRNNNHYRANTFKKLNGNTDRSKSFANHLENGDSIGDTQYGGGFYGGAGGGRDMGKQKEYQNHGFGNERDDNDMNEVESSNVDKGSNNKFNNKKRATDFGTHMNKNKYNQGGMTFGNNQDHIKKRNDHNLDENMKMSSNIIKKNNQKSNNRFNDFSNQHDRGSRYNNANNINKRQANQVGQTNFGRNANLEKTIKRDVGHAKN